MIKLCKLLLNKAVSVSVSVSVSYKNCPNTPSPKAESILNCPYKIKRETSPCILCLNWPHPVD